MLSVVGAYEYGGGGHDFCALHFVRPKVGLAINRGLRNCLYLCLGDGGDS
jgi:hypothetical protein